MGTEGRGTSRLQGKDKKTLNEREYLAAGHRSIYHVRDYSGYARRPTRITKAREKRDTRNEWWQSIKPVNSDVSFLCTSLFCPTTQRASERASQPDTVERAHKDVATYALLPRAADASWGGAERDEHLVHPGFLFTKGENRRERVEWWQLCRGRG